MGTSKSQGSPSTLPWKAVRAAYVDPAFSPAQVARLIWRANSRDGENELSTILGAPEVLASFRALAACDSPEDAVEAVNRAGAKAQRATIATDLARRAAVRAFMDANRSAGFVAALFDEATNYLVSRDLPGLVGIGPNLQNVRAAQSRKTAIRAVTRRIAADLAAHADDSANATQWDALVSRICVRLRNA